ncbi:hypothetical protein KOR34_01070 [Posidoniimonas corsicana]|uniref:Uncharacterized protein n=1 Tax=Posidoniimonas corsicana TaxID=1938618 RepID=A0A5C5VBM0_9BACT|nr:hypothetical protein [Posidoniimonas corsicana]TWT35219.1 hypothetical protein KOR34_01070 [Posidoniimonas corsicana]
MAGREDARTASKGVVGGAARNARRETRTTRLRQEYIKLIDKQVLGGWYKKAVERGEVSEISFESRYKELCTLSKAGQQTSNFKEFVDVVAAWLHACYPSDRNPLQGKTYGDLAEDPSALSELVRQMPIYRPAERRIDSSHVAPTALTLPAASPGIEVPGQPVLPPASWRSIGFQRNIALGACALLIVVTAVQTFARWTAPLPPTPSSDITVAAEQLDSHVFYPYGENSSYEHARVIPNTNALYDTTSFKVDMGHATQTFDMIATNAGNVRHRWGELLLDGLRRGVHYRLLIADYREGNQGYTMFHDHTNHKRLDEPRSVSRTVHEGFDELLQRLRADKVANRSNPEFPGSLEVRWNSRLPLYSLWLIDSKGPAAFGHVGLHLYRDKEHWSYFRLSNRTAPESFANLVGEFEYAWQNSLPYQTQPLPDDTTAQD